MAIEVPVRDSGRTLVCDKANSAHDSSDESSSSLAGEALHHISNTWSDVLNLRATPLQVGEVIGETALALAGAKGIQLAISGAAATSDAFRFADVTNPLLKASDASGFIAPNDAVLLDSANKAAPLGLQDAMKALKEHNAATDYLFPEKARMLAARTIEEQTEGLRDWVRLDKLFASPDYAKSLESLPPEHTEVLRYQAWMKAEELAKRVNGAVKR